MQKGSAFIKTLDKIINFFHCLNSLGFPRWYFRYSFQSARYYRYLLAAKYATKSIAGSFVAYNFGLLMRMR